VNVMETGACSAPAIGIVLARREAQHPHPILGLHIMKLWLLACGAIAVVAARAVYTLSTRQSRRTRFTGDQVSSEWLATAKIHEDHP
jgi:hypothetical protein